MDQLRDLLLISETRLLRFWFGLFGLAFAVFLMTAADDHWEYRITFAMAPAGFWVAALAINGLAMVYGAVTRNYSPFAFIMEDVLGVLTWTSLSITSMISQGTIGGVTVAALINIYLLMRYPAWK